MQQLSKKTQKGQQRKEEVCAICSLFCPIYKLKVQANCCRAAGRPVLFHSASGVLSGLSVWHRTTRRASSSFTPRCWNTFIKGI